MRDARPARGRTGSRAAGSSESCFLRDEALLLRRGDQLAVDAAAPRRRRGRSRRFRGCSCVSGPRCVCRRSALISATCRPRRELLARPVARARADRRARAPGRASSVAQARRPAPRRRRAARESRSRPSSISSGTPPAARGDDRLAEQHALENHAAERLGAHRGVDDDVPGVHHVGNVGAEAGEVHAIARGRARRCARAAPRRRPRRRDARRRR